MNNLGCIIKVPGKLMIAGEYAVLEPGLKAVVIAVERYITADIRPSLVNELSLPQLGLEEVTWNYGEEDVIFNIKDERLNFIKNAINTAAKFLKEKGIYLQPFRLYIKSDLNDPVTGKKYGLGSSAAIVVAVISSILSFHGEFNNEEDPMMLFKLSAIAHLITQGNGSGADIAAAVYGGWIKYSTYSSKWLLTELWNSRNILNLLDMPWPNLLIGRLTPPEELKLAVGWTQESVGTAPMVGKIEAYQDENSEYYQVFLQESNASVTELINAFESGNNKKALEALYKNRIALLKLSERAGVDIETKNLKLLCTIADKYGRGKSSGAGGGDCGIAFIDGEQKLQELWREWQDAGILPLDLIVAPNGCTVYNAFN